MIRLALLALSLGGAAAFPLQFVARRYFALSIDCCLARLLRS